MTYTRAKAICREKGISLRKKDGEFRVNFTGGKEKTAYYTNDLNDAIDTAQSMILRRAAREWLSVMGGN